jgi:N-acetylglutamate synthase-like GNAT family acetyltransferase
LNLADESLEAEREQQHFGLFDNNGILLACVAAALLWPSMMKLRQMAVATEYHRQGLATPSYGERFIEIGLPHVEMRKQLTD